MKFVYTQSMGATHWACSQKNSGFPQSPMKAHIEQVNIFLVVVLKKNDLERVLNVGLLSLQ
jgi:hypothetical protein